MTLSTKNPQAETQNSVIANLDILLPAGQLTIKTIKALKKKIVIII